MKRRAQIIYRPGVGSRQVSPAKREWYPHTGSLAAEAIRIKRLRAIHDVALVPAAQNSSIVKEKGIRSFVCTPLLVKEEVLGLLYVDYGQSRHFSDEDVRTIERLPIKQRWQCTMPSVISSWKRHKIA